ncbi:MAG: hypothetical protein RLZZ303_3633 [Candidatus Hydrogenedentota bacterium]|jgi:prepilin-type N-terminal cleavage/methylation domain-containing protein
MRRNGFTLVEVLAAVAILGTAMFVLLDAHYTSMRLQETMQLSASYRQMLEMTVNRAEVEVLRGELAGGGEFGPRFPGFTWSYDAVPAAKEGIHLYEVNVRVTGPESEEMRTFLVYKISSDEETEGGLGSGFMGVGGASRAPAAGGAAR